MNYIRSLSYKPTRICSKSGSQRHIELDYSGVAASYAIAVFRHLSNSIILKNPASARLAYLGHPHKSQSAGVLVPAVTA